MTLFLLLSCGSGSTNTEELQSKFLNVFTSFGDMLGGVLGFNTTTNKSDVAAYFKTVHDTVQGTKTSLDKIVSDMKSKNNPNAANAERVVKEVGETLSKIIDGAKTASDAIGSEGTELLGNVAAQNNGGAAGDVDKLVQGIKSIVDVVLKNEGKHDAGDNKKAEDGSTARTAAGDGEAGKLFGNAAIDNAANAKKSAADAAKAVGAVTGADILKAIVKDGTSAAAVAAGAKDGSIAGAIALRAMAKGGKFANDNAGTAEVTAAVKGAAVSAVTKALNTLTIAIRNTIDSGLKKINAELAAKPADATGGQ
nr:variable large family protein [Candidatus Borrelia fainii]